MSLYPHADLLLQNLYEWVLFFPMVSVFVTIDIQILLIPEQSESVWHESFSIFIVIYGVVLFLTSITAIGLTTVV